MEGAEVLQLSQTDSRGSMAGKPGRNFHGL